MHLTRTLETAPSYAVMGLYRNSSFGGKRIVGRDKAEMGINHPLQDVESEHFVARVRSGQLAQNPLDVGGHESRESAGGAENRAQKSGDVGVHDALGQPNPPPGQSWAVAGAKSKRVSEKEEIAMKSTEHGIEESKAVENMYHMRLMALLQEQVRKRGTKGAARVLEIDPKTVAESIRTGRLSRRTRDALERGVAGGHRLGCRTPA